MRAVFSILNILLVMSTAHAADLPIIATALAVKLVGTNASGQPTGYIASDGGGGIKVQSLSLGPIAPSASAAASYSSLGGGIYNTVLPTVTNGQQVAIQLDSSGRQLVNASGTTQPISGTVAVSNFPAIQPVSQSGTWTIGRTWSLLNTTDSVNIGNFPASQAVTGPLTDTQLRASPVPVSGSFTLPTGSATFAAQASGNASLASIDSKITTTANGVKVDGSAVTQPISAASLPLPSGAATSALQTTGNSTLSTISSQLPSSLGAKIIANSLAVNIASDQIVPISATSLPLPTGAATVAGQASGNTILSSIDTKTPALVSGRVPVDGSGVIQPVSQSGTWNLNNITGTINLPTGASTLAAQASISSTLSTISGQLPLTLGAKTIANSLAVNIASDQVLNTQQPLDGLYAPVNITTQDLASTTTTGYANQSMITGTPTVNSVSAQPLASIQTVMVIITGTWTGTLSTEVSSDGGTIWEPRSVHVVGTPTFSSNITANVVGSMNGTAKTNVRVRATAPMTGTATVRFLISDNVSNIYVANSIKLVDSSSTTSTVGLTIKAANTAATSADTSAVVSISPNTAISTKTALSASAPTVINVTTSSSQLVAANANRKGLVLTNVSRNTMSFGFGSPAVLYSGITLYPGGVYVMDEYMYSLAQVLAIASSSPASCAIQEY